MKSSARCLYGTAPLLLVCCLQLGSGRLITAVSTTLTGNVASKDHLSGMIEQLTARGALEEAVSACEEWGQCEGDCSEDVPSGIQTCIKPAGGSQDGASLTRPCEPPCWECRIGYSIADGVWRYTGPKLLYLYDRAVPELSAPKGTDYGSFRPGSELPSCRSRTLMLSAEETLTVCGDASEAINSWTWKPRECKLPEFDAARYLNLFRDKNVLFVGDSLMLNFFTSFDCLLEISGSISDVKYGSTSDTNLEKVGTELTGESLYIKLYSKEFNSSVTYVRSNFLVKPKPHPQSPNDTRVFPTEEISDGLRELGPEADFIVIGTGQWWHGGNVYIEDGRQYWTGGPDGFPFSFGLSIFQERMWTVSKYIDSLPKSPKVVWTDVPVYHSNCHEYSKSPTEWELVKDKIGITSDDGVRIASLNKVIENILTHFPEWQYLPMFPISAGRPDAHYGAYAEALPGKRWRDCLHYCMPGVPDHWSRSLLSIALYVYGQ